MKRGQAIRYRFQGIFVCAALGVAALLLVVAFTDGKASRGAVVGLTVEAVVAAALGAAVLFAKPDKRDRA